MNYTEKVYCEKCVKRTGDITKVSTLPKDYIFNEREVLRVCKLHGDIYVYETMSLNDIETHVRQGIARLANIGVNLEAMHSNELAGKNDGS